MKSEHNDANSAALMKFMHDVGKKVEAWMELEENAEYRREDFKYMFFAYLDTSRPPFGEDANGNINIAADLKFEDGVNVAPFFAQSHLHTGVSFDDNANIEHLETYNYKTGKFEPLDVVNNSFIMSLEASEAAFIKVVEAE